MINPLLRPIGIGLIRTQRCCAAVLLLFAATFSCPAQLLSQQVETLPQARISLLDGTKFDASISELNANTLRFGKASDIQTTRLNSVERIEFPSSKSDQPTAEFGLLTLVSGSELPFVSVAATTRQLRVELPSASSSVEKAVTVSTDSVASLRFPNRPPALAEVWDNLRKTSSDGDRVMVLRGGGKSLDYVEGVVNEITSQAISLSLDGEMIDAPLDRIYGLTLAYTAGQNESEGPQSGQHSVLLTEDGFRIVAKRILVDSSDPLSVTIQTVSGLNLTLATEKVSLIDYSAGKLDYLSDFTPAEQNWRPLFGTPQGLLSSLGATGGLGPLRQNRGFWSPKITLVDTRSNQNTESFTKGLAIRTNAKINYRLDKAYSLLTFVAGVAPDAAAGRSITLRVIADGETLLNTKLHSNAQAETFRLPLNAAAQLSLVVERAQGSLDSTLHLGDVRLLQ